MYTIADIDRWLVENRYQVDLIINSHPVSSVLAMGDSNKLGRSMDDVRQLAEVICWLTYAMHDTGHLDYNCYCQQILRMMIFGMREAKSPISEVKTMAVNRMNYFLTEGKVLAESDYLTREDYDLWFAEKRESLEEDWELSRDKIPQNIRELFGGPDGCQLAYYAGVFLQNMIRSTGGDQRIEDKAAFSHLMLTKYSKLDQFDVVLRILRHWMDTGTILEKIGEPFSPVNSDKIKPSRN